MYILKAGASEHHSYYYVFYNILLKFTLSNTSYNNISLRKKKFYFKANWVQYILYQLFIYPHYTI